MAAQSGTGMTEVLFYHLTEHRLEQALPGLLERCLERSWKVVVQTASEERRDALDAHLWTYRDESFLPHGREGDPASHPVWLTTDNDNPNGAQVRFVVDGADPPSDIDSYERVVVMFDGHDEEATTRARGCWKTQSQTDHELTYWLQENGRWVKKA